MLDTSLTKLPRAETSLSDLWRIRAQEINSKVCNLKRWRLITMLLKLVEYLLTGLQYCFPNDTTHLHLLQHSLVLTNLIILTKSFINPGHDTPGGNSDFVQCNDKLVLHIWQSNFTSQSVNNPILPLCSWTPLSSTTAFSSALLSRAYACVKVALMAPVFWVVGSSFLLRRENIKSAKPFLW